MFEVYLNIFPQFDSVSGVLQKSKIKWAVLKVGRSGITLKIIENPIPFQHSHVCNQFLKFKSLYFIMCNETNEANEANIKSRFGLFNLNFDLIRNLVFLYLVLYIRIWKSKC